MDAPSQALEGYCTPASWQFDWFLVPGEPIPLFLAFRGRVTSQRFLRISPTKRLWIRVCSERELLADEHCKLAYRDIGEPGVN